jgi:hypothetical protein
MDRVQIVKASEASRNQAVVLDISSVRMTLRVFHSKRETKTHIHIHYSAEIIEIMKMKIMFANSPRGRVSDGQIPWLTPFSSTTQEAFVSSLL